MMTTSTTRMKTTSTRRMTNTFRKMMTTISTTMIPFKQIYVCFQILKNVFNFLCNTFCLHIFAHGYAGVFFKHSWKDTCSEAFFRMGSEKPLTIDDKSSIGWQSSFILSEVGQLFYWFHTCTGFPFFVCQTDKHQRELKVATRRVRTLEVKCTFYFVSIASALTAVRSWSFGSFACNLGRGGCSPSFSRHRANIATMRMAHEKKQLMYKCLS